MGKNEIARTQFGSIGQGYWVSKKQFTSVFQPDTKKALKAKRRAVSHMASTRRLEKIWREMEKKLGG